MNTMRSHTARSSTECVVNTTVADRSASWRRRAISSALVTGSRPDVGSSRKKTRIGEQLDGDAGAFALPAAQRADPDVGLIGQAHGVERVTDRVVDVGRACRRREP